MKYNNHLNYKKRRSFLLKMKLVLVVFALLILIAGLFVAREIFGNEKNSISQTTSEPTTSSVAQKVNIFRSPFFQFQTDKSWVEIPAESTQTKFLYRSLRTNLIEHELVIYVDQIPANLSATRILPVQLENEMSELLSSKVSEHCQKAVAPAQKSETLIVTLDRVQFNCDADSTSYSIFVGIDGGSSSMKMQRPDKSIATYLILYTNLKATPDPDQILQISNSFQTR